MIVSARSKKSKFVLSPRVEDSQLEMLRQKVESVQNKD